MLTSPVSPPIKAAMISSTVSNLQEHREEAKKACLALGLLPRMMDHLGSLSADVIEASRSLVDQSHYYIGIFGQKYGTIPPGHTISITEIELNHAISRGIPCLIFIMDDDYLIRKSDIDCKHEEELKRLIKNISTKVSARFKSPERLFGDLILALSKVIREEERRAMDEGGTQ